ncbi:hypothetical protein QJS10_CPA01g01740 [Acorus calamus]|uniref:CCHC-type domain-containing protein n=1 Tax=Acorus calamus TaxID=4465 RepID=A0AAV9FJ36_ACOCL|nr:hypothetical protein QJS10_CPA01g01756 [Acorus calamus]KAK1326189.1 hypothetical protein QJS10_CPA01g01740 [Acorus calamus]
MTVGDLVAADLDSDGSIRCMVSGFVLGVSTNIKISPESRMASGSGWCSSSSGSGGGNGWTTVRGKRERKRLRTEGRSRGSGRIDESGVRCFRCLRLGHRSIACRDPLLCWHCKCSGHRGASCPKWIGARDGRKLPEAIGSSKTVKLPVKFCAAREMEYLKGCLLATTATGSPSLCDLREALTKWGGAGAVDRVRRVGAGFFLIRMRSLKLRYAALNMGRLEWQGGGGPVFNLESSLRDHGRLSRDLDDDA